MRQEDVAKIPAKRGPKPGPQTVPVTVWLEPELAEWGKMQPGGLSALLRDLLQKKHRQATRREDAKP